MHYDYSKNETTIKPTYNHYHYHKNSNAMKKSIAAALLLAVAAPISGVAQTSEGQKTAYMVSDAHLDTQWNWDIQTTIADYIPKTIRQNLHLLATYPDYIFNFEGAQKYAWMKEYYPREYAEMKPYVESGRWHLTGASWDANETVIVSAESWLRNILQGQTFYREEFGKESTDVFLPDCFGFSYFIPTLAAHCRLIGFSSQKLGWRTHPFYEGNKKYPFTVGLWQGIDGSRIMMTHGFGYNDRYKDEDLSFDQKLQSQIAESPLGIVYKYYGTGDTGGSPDIPSVRGVIKGMQGNGPVKIIAATSDQIYKDFQPYDSHPELPVFDGELFMDVHGSGCYTSQAAMKLYNRQNEHLADAAERSSVVAECIAGAAYPQRDLQESWRRVILHQFHDDLPGTCIPKAYEFSWNDELISLNRFSNILTTSVGAIARNMDTRVAGDAVVMVNTEAYPVATVAELKLPNMAASYTVKDHNGKVVPSQVVSQSNGERTLLVDATVPATGYAVYSVKATGKSQAAKMAQGNTIENSIYRLTVDNQGNISSIIDKRCGRNLVAEGQTWGLVVFDKCDSKEWPAWEIQKTTIDQEPLPVRDNVEIAIIESGAVRQTLKVKKTYGGSTFEQYIRLYNGSEADRIDVYNEIDWHSANSLLKASFPMSVSNPKATYDIGLGAVERGNNRDNAYEVYSHEWTDLTDQSGDYGVTILNNCKYGWDKPTDNTLRLSLLFAPKTGGAYAYQAQQDMGFHTFTYSIVGHEGKLDRANAVRRATTLNSPLRAFSTPKHKGQLGNQLSFASIDNPNVSVRAIKRAETSDEYVVRVYEDGGTSSQTAKISFAAPIQQAVEADGTEQTLGAATFEGNTLNVSVKAHGVSTYKVKLASQAAVELQQEPVSLPYNMRCFTSNDYRAGAEFEGGNSYAAELLPTSGLNVDGVHFVFGDIDGPNGMACHGDTVAIPAGTTRLYMLAASKNGDNQAQFSVGGKATTLLIPYYSGFVGQWEHTGHTKGYLKDAEVAYVGTHRHSAKADEPYELTYMFKMAIDVPAGANSIIMPSDDNIVVFALTATSDNIQPVAAACRLFTTGNKTDKLDVAASQKKHENLLKNAQIIDVSGETNQGEKAANLVDGSLETKWCDTNLAPNYVVFDLGQSRTLSGWTMTNAGEENSEYITRCCMVEGRNTTSEEWHLLDMIDGNKSNVINRTFKPTECRYVRLYVVGPTQEARQDALRIYEFGVY